MFVIHIIGLKLSKTAISIYQSRISLLTTLRRNKISIKIPAECVEYLDIFSLDLAKELSENTGINKYTIKLIKGKELPFDPIYSLGPVELKMLKGYIETKLKIGFIQSSKLSASVLIFLNRKSYSILYLSINY